jgi:hypothetical protein
MKYVITLLALLALPVQAESLYNQALKECLAKSGFVAGKTHVLNYDWSKASSCTNAKAVKIEQARIATEREFLKNNPHYTGSNFKWEDKAEYFCERIYSEQLSHAITVCHKPYFVN